MHVSGVQRISADKGRDRCVWRVAKPPGFDMTNNKMPQQYSLQDDEPKIYVLFWQKGGNRVYSLINAVYSLINAVYSLINAVYSRINAVSSKSRLKSHRNFVVDSFTDSTLSVTNTNTYFIFSLEVDKMYLRVWRKQGRLSFSLAQPSSICLVPFVRPWSSVSHVVISVQIRLYLPGISRIIGDLEASWRAPRDHHLWVTIQIEPSMSSPNPASSP
jgi:hypothetical protein